MIKLRCATREDVPDIAQLLEELGYKSDVKIIKDRFSKIKEQNGQVIVAVNTNQEVLGCVHVFIDLRLAEGEIGEIVNLVVRNDTRRQGIGKKLLNEAKSWITANGCFNIRIRANTVREQAHQFYQRHGFSEIKSQKVLQANVVMRYNKVHQCGQAASLWPRTGHLPERWSSPGRLMIFVYLKKCPSCEYQATGTIYSF